MTTAARKLTMAQAIAEAIGQEMERDPKVFVMGEDIARYGGIFSATSGLLDRFGPERIMDTPISETAFIGAATGAAAEGFRPIAELMFADFFGVCMDQIYNHLAKNTYMSGGGVRLPVVLMTAIGGGYSDAAQHSQCLYGLFAHVPGLKIVVPSNAYDAKGLMIQAIRDDNPVMYFFHKGIMGLPWMAYYEGSATEVPETSYTIPFGQARIAREGTDVTIVTLSQMVQKALVAAAELGRRAFKRRSSTCARWYRLTWMQSCAQSRRPDGCSWPTRTTSTLGLRGRSQRSSLSVSTALRSSRRSAASACPAYRSRTAGRSSRRSSRR